MYYQLTYIFPLRSFSIPDLSILVSADAHEMEKALQTDVKQRQWFLKQDLIDFLGEDIYEYWNEYMNFSIPDEIQPHDLKKGEKYIVLQPQ